MNVLQLVSGRALTGPVASALLDARALKAAGHTVTVITGEVPRLAQACQAAGVAHCGALKFGRGAGRLLALKRDAARLRMLLRELAAGVIHVHRSGDQFLAAAAAGRDSTVRIVRSWHRAPASLPQWLSKLLTASDTGCLCAAREHVALLKSAGVACCEFIPATVDTDMFKPSPASATDATPLLGQVGRWKAGQDRGQNAALEVFARLDRKLLWRGVLLGRGEREAELLRRAEELNLPAERCRVFHFAKQAPEEFARILGGFALGFVFAAGSDGSSRPALEMLACGVPILVADRPGLRELAEDAACARRLLPGDPSGWAHAVEALLRDPAALQSMRLAARARAERVHALPVRGAALAEFYRSV